MEYIKPQDICTNLHRDRERREGEISPEESPGKKKSSNSLWRERGRS